MSTRVQVINRAEIEQEGGCKLSFQWVRYLYGNGGLDYGYRFIWMDENGNLMAHRGQARIPSIQIMMELVERAQKEGWGDYDSDVLNSMGAMTPLPQTETESLPA